MTAQSRPTNTSRFEQGDSPQGTDFRDLIDSFVALVDTTAQTVASDLRAANLMAAGKVSAATFNITTINASSVSGALVVGASASFNNEAVGVSRVDTLFVATSARIQAISMAGKITGQTASFAAVVSATSLIVDATAQFSLPIQMLSGNAVTAVSASADTGKLLPLPYFGTSLPSCRGYIRIKTESTVVCVPYWHSST